VDADSPIPLCTPANFQESPFADLVAKYSDQALADLAGEATRVCEGMCEGRRLAPFTITETLRADAIDPDEYPAGASLPMPIQGTLGWSEALALGGGSDLVRHSWLTHYPMRYPDLWRYSGVSVTVIRSYSGTETFQQARLLDGPDDKGHAWFQIGALVPVGSRTRWTYSGGYTVAMPGDLVRAGRLMMAWIVLTELDPEDTVTGHDPDRLYKAARRILAGYGAKDDEGGKG
jgi:hypothetical protein